MNSARLWIVLLAVTSFLAGSAGGLLGASRIAPPPPERRPFADYEELLVSRYDLSGIEVRRLQAILERYHTRIEALKARHTSELEPELIKLGLTCREQIRDYVLSEEQRGELDRGLQSRYASGTEVN